MRESDLRRCARFFYVYFPKKKRNRTPKKDEKTQKMATTTTTTSNKNNRPLSVRHRTPSKKALELAALEQQAEQQKVR